MVHLLPSTLRYIIKNQLSLKLIYEKNGALKMEKNLELPQVLLSFHMMKSPVLPVLKVELAGFSQALGHNNKL
jgi:hypothetical protein